ncbi:cobyrinate a,c-diamide synthase [Pseudomonadota bacterium]
MKTRHCPALIIAAPSSGQGKTTVTAALARYHRHLGRNVRVFKTGPDFLDPMILEQASGHPVYQLDMWMGGEQHCRELLYAAAGEADLILIEGVMGLFDGTNSSADLARLFNIPVMAVIDGSAMAQTFGALAHGLATYQTGLPFVGVFANRVAGEGHYQMLVESLPAKLTSFGWMRRDQKIALPERHLGLVQAEEISDLGTRINHAADSLKDVPNSLPTAVAFTVPIKKPKPVPGPLLQGVRIAVARDAAFAFIYHANLDVLRTHGAVISFFSPLDDHAIPKADALYFPGGYPELHSDQLVANHPIKAAIQKHQAACKPIVAECGGMLYLLASLTDIHGHTVDMVGLLPGKAMMRSKLTNLGLHHVTLPEGELRGHTFHHSTMECDLTPLTFTEPARHHGTAEAVFRDARLTASYFHFYFPSAPDAAARLFLP